MTRRAWDWKREFARQHGRPPEAVNENPRSSSNRDVSADGRAWQDGAPPGNRPVAVSDTAATTGNGAGAEPAGHEGPISEGEGTPAVAAAAEPGSEPSPVDLLRLADDGGPHVDFERVEIAPHQFVNLSAARQLGLVKGVGE